MGTTSRIAATLVLAAGLCLPTALDAPGPTRTVPKPAGTLENYGASDQGCREWTNGCVTCLRRDDGTAGCSLPGIALPADGYDMSERGAVEFGATIVKASSRSRSGISFEHRPNFAAHQREFGPSTSSAFGTRPSSSRCKNSMRCGLRAVPIAQAARAFPSRT